MVRYSYSIRKEEIIMAKYELTEEQVTALKNMTKDSNDEALQGVTKSLDNPINDIFVLTEDDVASVATDSDDDYSHEDIDEAIKVISRGNIDFDWYNTVQDVLDNVKSF